MVGEVPLRISFHVLHYRRVLLCVEKSRNAATKSRLTLAIEKGLNGFYCYRWPRPIARIGLAW